MKIFQKKDIPEHLLHYFKPAELGLEPTPEAYVDKLVQVFRDVRRVLKEDGVLWLNLGDAYCSIGHKKSHSGYGTTGLAGGKAQEHSPMRRENNASSLGLKHKDLIGIPWRVAFALQADGYYLRQDIIWSKPNPMPESVTDRCTKSHEYLFLLTKNERYYWDQTAMREPSLTGDPRKPYAPGQVDNRGNGHDRNGGIMRAPIQNGYADAKTRNRRSVWTINTEPYPGAHFATFPRALVQPCILAGSRPGDLVLDCFAGSGTVLEVAKKYGRRGIGIELKPDYCQLAADRLRHTTPSLFAPPPPKPEQLSLLEGK